MLYHASARQGLDFLEPRASTHGKAYVYAISSRVTAACFGAAKDDFDLLMDEEDGITRLSECRPGALESIYGGKSCSLYSVSEEDFRSGLTGWDAERVCEHAVPVVREERIEDLYAFLTDAAERGECVINRYSEEEEYQAMLREELGERIRDFGLTEEQVRQDERLRRIFAD